MRSLSQQQKRQMVNGRINMLLERRTETYNELLRRAKHLVSAIDEHPLGVVDPLVATAARHLAEMTGQATLPEIKDRHSTEEVAVHLFHAMYDGELDPMYVWSRLIDAEKQKWMAHATNLVRFVTQPVERRDDHV